MYPRERFRFARAFRHQAGCVHLGKPRARSPGVGHRRALVCRGNRPDRVAGEESRARASGEWPAMVEQCAARLLSTGCRALRLGGAQSKAPVDAERGAARRIRHGTSGTVRVSAPMQSHRIDTAGWNGLRPQRRDRYRAGTYTVMTMLAADCLGVPIERVRFGLGDSAMPRRRSKGIRPDGRTRQRRPGGLCRSRPRIRESRQRRRGVSDQGMSIGGHHRSRWRHPDH